jgi:hypothetical protein
LRRILAAIPQRDKIDVAASHVSWASRSGPTPAFFDSSLTSQVIACLMARTENDILSGASPLAQNAPAAR